MSRDLTERQGQVLLELSWFGGTDAEIAERLGISRYTVKAHIATMLRREGLHNRTALVAWAWRTGLVDG